MGIFDNLYQAPPPKPFLPTTPLPQVQQTDTGLHIPSDHPLYSAFQQLLTGGTATQQPKETLASQLTALRNDPVGDANRGYKPGVDNEFSPFANGFFKTAAGRNDVIASRGAVGGGYGAAPGSYVLPPLSKVQGALMALKYTKPNSVASN